MTHRIMKIVLYSVVVFSTILTIASASELNIRLNCSDRNWYPFLYTRDDQVRGILYDIVRQAMENLKINAIVEPVPFRRAIVTAQRGKTDGVLGIGYRQDLAQDLEYPLQASTDTESPWRILQLDHVVVSVTKTDYTFSGDLGTLPEPVRLLQGSPLIEDLNQAGIIPQEVREDEQNFLKLIRDREGVIITTSVAAEMMIRDLRFRGKIRIHATPVASHSYYLAFSKKSRLTTHDRMVLWKEIRRLRDDYIFMLQVFSQY